MATFLGVFERVFLDFRQITVSARGKLGLAAILAADVVGYSRRVAEDELSALAQVRALRSDVIEPLSSAHGGHMFAVMGDGFLIEFSSTVQAVTCALAIQARMADQPSDLQLRIGVHVGDVVVHENGVNVAVRLESIAEPGSVCISERVAEDVAGKLTVRLTDLGMPPLKNIDRPIRGSPHDLFKTDGVDGAR